MQKSDKEKYFCILPWVHARMNQDGSLYPCCRMEQFYPYGSLREKDFKTIWNDEPIRTMRKALMQGQAFPSCKDCYNIESQGGNSLRQQSNIEYKNHFKKILETAEDGTVPSTELIFLDLRFSNVCNFRCRTCNPENSTGWYLDASRLSGETPNGIIRPTVLPFQMWNFIEQQLPTLKRIYFAGGEPLLQDEHYELLEKLMASKRNDIFLTYNTNFSKLNHKSWSTLEFWKQFPKVAIAASLDAVAEQGEFLRKGMSWKKTVQNFKIVKREVPHAQFSVFPTVSAINAYHLTEAIETFIELEMIKSPEDIKLNFLLQPKYLSICLFDSRQRANLTDHYCCFLAKISGKVSEALHQHLRDELQHLVSHMNSGPSEESQRSRFRKFSNRLDRLRKEKMILLFPDLFELLYANVDSTNASIDSTGASEAMRVLTDAMPLS